MPDSNTMSGANKSPYVDSGTAKDKFLKKAKEAPFVPLGILGFVSAVSYGGYMYKKRGLMSTSVYIMKFRVISQSMVVGAIAIGVGMTILPKLYKKLDGNSDSGKSS